MRGLTVALAIGALGGCGPPAPTSSLPPPTTSTTPPRPPPAPTPSALGAGKWGDFVSRRFELRLPLPDGRAWQIDDHRGPWLSAVHGPTGSALLVRTWREDGVATRSRCEEKARSWQKLPERQGAEILEQRAAKAPEGFDTQVEVGLIPPAGGAPLTAFAMAFGGRAHRCFAYVFTTSAGGQGAEEVVGERLATMVQGSLEGIVIENDLDPKIPREAPSPAR